MSNDIDRYINGNRILKDKNIPKERQRTIIGKQSCIPEGSRKEYFAQITLTGGS